MNIVVFSLLREATQHEWYVMQCENNVFVQAADELVIGLYMNMTLHIQCGLCFNAHHILYESIGEKKIQITLLLLWFQYHKSLSKKRKSFVETEKKMKRERKSAGMRMRYMMIGWKRTANLYLYWQNAKFDVFVYLLRLFVLNGISSKRFTLNRSPVVCFWFYVINKWINHCF